ncbi:MAG: hypothetical protein U0229_08325 [Anaeromyxobacter sp.]
MTRLHAFLLALACAAEPGCTPRSRGDSTAEEGAPAPPPPASSRPRPVARYDVTILPPERGPGGARVPGRAVFTILPEGRDGHAGTNPPRTVELKGGPFVWGYTDACFTAGISTPVTVTNFLPERLADVHVAFTIDDAEHPLCGAQAQPTGGEPPLPKTTVVFDPPPARAGPSGYLQYVLPDQYPKRVLAGSPVDDGSAPGGAATVDWAFVYLVEEAPPFHLKADLWADPYPAAPTALPFPVVEPGEPVILHIVDVGDQVMGTLPARVTEADVRVCDAPFAADGSCSGAELPALAFVRNTYLYVVEVLTYIPEAVVPGRTYHYRAVGMWDSDGNAATPPVRGSFPLATTFVAMGLPAVATYPLPGPPDAFVWTVEGAQVTAPDGRQVLRICTREDCWFDPPPWTIVYSTSSFTAVETAPGSGTWRYEADAAEIQAALRASVSNGPFYLAVRNLRPASEGAWRQADAPFYYYWPLSP